MAPKRPFLFSEDSDSEGNEPEPSVFSVSQLNSLVQRLLSDTFSGILVEGEITEISRPHSGHIYFSLKDEDSQIRGVMWRSTAQRLKFELEEGQTVVCRGDIDVYPPRGTYQLVVKQVDPKGIGPLQLAFRQLHQRLSAEGLFEAKWKQEIPSYPQSVAFVTSPTGAAIRDFLEISRRRFPSLPILVIPARVQGEGAAEEIVRGIEAANHLQDRPDILVVGRGGGSMEDLWCFNDERVVRAIFASEIPVVSAVGHEIDVTLADLVADMRAATPSEAAERIVPSRDELLNQNFQRQQRLASALRRRFEFAELSLQSLLSRRIFTQPLEWLMLRSQEIDELTLELERATSTFWDRKEEQLRMAAGKLESLSPLQVLSRGYSVTTRNSDQKLIRSSNDVREGDILRTRLAEGEVLSQVKSSTSSS